MIVNELPRKYTVEMTAGEAKAIVRALRWLQWRLPEMLSGEKSVAIGNAGGDWDKDLPLLHELHDRLTEL